MDNTLNELRGLIERSTASNLDMIQFLGEHFRALADRVVILEAEVEFLRGQAPPRDREMLQ